MNIFKEQVEYLKDNPEGYWFKRKLYGWGWTPAKWQGWVAVLVFIAILFLNLWRINSTSYTDTETLTSFIPETLVLVFLFILFCYKKGEKPKWMWGPEKKK